MTTEAKKLGVAYTVENDRIFRDDGTEKEQVAKYDSKSGVVEMMPEKASYRSRVMAHLNDKGHKFSEFGKIGMDLRPAGLPPKPKKNPRLGDKTPEVVEWYAKHRQEVFIAKFGVRELQVRTHFDEFDRKVRDEETGKDVIIKEKVPVYRTIEGLDYSINSLLTGEQRLIADCQTHLTSKMREDESSEEYDWSLDTPND
jgi:hypothetical protein